MKDRVDICFSILVHEQPHFFEQQLKNIQFFLMQSSYMIVVHFNTHIWQAHHTLLKEICDTYSVIINENHYDTAWSSSSLFDAHVTNMKLALDRTFTYFMFLSSNELFFKKGFVKMLDDLKFDLIEIEEVRQLTYNERIGMNNDEGFQKFTANPHEHYHLGFDFGRTLTFETTAWLYKELTTYWNVPISPSIYNYSMLEFVIPTVLHSKPNLLYLPIQLSMWYNGEHLEDLQKRESTEYIVKHVPREINHYFMKEFNSII
jgi:hypothetical protein